MAVIENSVEINRPHQVVFEYCVDLRNELEWNPDAQSMRKLTDGPIGVGTKFLAKWKQSKLLEVECTKYDHPHAWQYVNGGPLSIMMKLFFPILLQILKRAERRNMQNIKNALEKS